MNQVLDVYHLMKSETQDHVKGTEGTSDRLPSKLGMTYLLRGDRLLASLAKLFNGLGVIAQILFAANKNDRETLAEMKNLGNPLQIEHVLVM